MKPHGNKKGASLLPLSPCSSSRFSQESPGLTELGTTSLAENCEVASLRGPISSCTVLLEGCYVTNSCDLLEFFATVSSCSVLFWKHLIQVFLLGMGFRNLCKYQSPQLLKSPIQKQSTCLSLAHILPHTVK